METTVNPRFRITGRVVLRRIGEDRLLVPVSGVAARENGVFPINETGEFMWNCLAQGRTPEETAAAVAAEFAVSPEDALSDCREFAARLLAQRLIEEAPP